MIDYRKLRFNNILSAEYRHLLLLIFWPLYLFGFIFLEKAITLEYNVIESSLDALIPFCEIFVIPYFLWYVYLVWMHIHTLLFDVRAFKKLMYFFIATYSVTLLIYIIFPNMQQLRVQNFERDNIFTDIVKWTYGVDTNTNVCPSLHVIGSFAVLFTSWNCKGMNNWVSRLTNIIVTLLISASTVFLKQHSIIDVLAAIVLCFAALPFAYIVPDKLEIRAKKKRESAKSAT